MVCFVCVFITLWVATGAGIHKDYDAPTPVRLLNPVPFHSFFIADHYSGQYWCWISAKFAGMRLGGEYIWLWIALFTSVVLYIPLYFWAEGLLSVDEESWYKFHMLDPDQRVRYAQRRAALGMLL
jgi:hypothetical protein